MSDTNTNGADPPPSAQHHHPTLLPPAPQLPPPFISTPTIPNLRDAGNSYPIVATPPQRVIRPLTLLRSADPSRADEAALATLRALRVSRVFDLRSKPEISKAGGAREDYGGGEVRRVWCPVFEESDYSPERLAARYEQYGREGTEGVVTAYRDILSHAGPAFGTIFRHIATLNSSEQPNALIVHCTAGKDRTGLFVALLLSMLGVDDEGVAEEYALTDVGMAHLKPMFVKRLMEYPSFKDDQAGAERMVMSRKENMLATMIMIREKYGSAEEYILTICGLTAEEIDSIRQVMVVSENQVENGDSRRAAL